MGDPLWVYLYQYLSGSSINNLWLKILTKIFADPAHVNQLLNRKHPNQSETWCWLRFLIPKSCFGLRLVAVVAQNSACYSVFINFKALNELLQLQGKLGTRWTGKERFISYSPPKLLKVQRKMTLRSCLKLNFRILFKFSLKLNHRILYFRSFWKLCKLK